MPNQSLEWKHRVSELKQELVFEFDGGRRRMDSMLLVIIGPSPWRRKRGRRPIAGRRWARWTTAPPIPVDSGMFLSVIFLEFDVSDGLVKIPDTTMIWCRPTTARRASPSCSLTVCVAGSGTLSYWSSSEKLGSFHGEEGMRRVGFVVAKIPMRIN